MRASGGTKMAKKIDICKKCKRERPIHARGVCKGCYRAPLRVCKLCRQLKHHQAKGLCFNCYQRNSARYNKIRDFNFRKWHNIGLKEWEEITEKCMICGFDKVIELHHLDKDHSNKSSQNLIGLCPNHHRMLHNVKYGKEIKFLIQSKLKDSL